MTLALVTLDLVTLTLVILVLVTSVPYDPRSCHDRVIRFAILVDG